MNLRGSHVTKISIDYRLALTLDFGWDVTLETPVFVSSGSIHTSPAARLTPQTQDVAAALSLFGAGVLSAVAFKSGSLRLVFDTGTHLNCPADRSFEAWQITGPRGWLFTSLPGGDLAVSSAPARTRKCPR